MKRWLRFNGVGLLGVTVQLAVIAVLVDAAHVHYLTATTIGVEAAILHNFVWHQKWTWRDRPSASTAGTWTRLARFHVLNGIVSLAGNTILVALLTGRRGLHPVASSAIAIGVCSIVNYVASEVLVFRSAASRTRARAEAESEADDLRRAGDGYLNRSSNAFRALV